MDRIMPLASMVKIMVAIEYAQQAAEGKIDPNESVKLAQIDKYYLPNLDGGAQPAWMEILKAQKLIKEDAVPLEEVANRGLCSSAIQNEQPHDLFSPSSQAFGYPPGRADAKPWQPGIVPAFRLQGRIHKLYVKHSHVCLG
ncbi:class A beta-lactamase-related serine hydrolase [Paenibacillus melissococcoides]|uniref:Class A beta-lactamase-related serine hydrolase n=2 Tax=Paenibacillus TaxID=44249 RepID=A0ABN8UAT7_9BACL|nr:class A beta-lactamase-related serine hydrolase [Paenibacillus melissococcoides]